jgi:hypothetical protein
MRMITVAVSDEFHSWLEEMQGRCVALHGVDFAFDCVTSDQRGQIHCQAIFKAAAESEGDPSVTQTIRAQDAAFAEMKREEQERREPRKDTTEFKGVFLEPTAEQIGRSIESLAAPMDALCRADVVLTLGADGSVRVLKDRTGKLLRS